MTIHLTLWIIVIIVNLVFSVAYFRADMKATVPLWAYYFVLGMSISFALIMGHFIK